MKNYLSILIAFMLTALVSCQPKQKTEPVDKKKVETEVLQFMDSLVVAFNSVSAENVFN